MQFTNGVLLRPSLETTFINGDVGRLLMGTSPFRLEDFDTSLVLKDD